MILKFYVKYQTLYLLSRDPVVADSSGYLQANFQFTEDWDGTNKTAQFKRTESDLITDGKPLFFNEEIDNNGNCIIPWEVLKGEGTFNVNVFGQKTESDGTTVKTITVNSLDIRVGQSGLTTNEIPQDSTPNQYDNIYEEIQKAEKKTQASQTAAAASQAAAKTSETNAANSASAAATSAMAVKNSQTAAASSASAAASSASKAAGSATSAANSASTATTQANTAKAWATSTESPDGATDTDSSTGKTQSSKSWALYSKDRATASASSASAAAGSASAAKTSETNAASSKSAAASSANTAGTQANTAKAWATSTTSPDNAADTSSTTGKTQSAKSWALYSKDRATASASSASAAAGSASAAKTSETNAASSKTAAATSATNAANSAKAAADSATAAANSAREQQADWNVTDTTSQAFIKNKPEVYPKATADAAGNNIQTTYVKKSDLSSSVSTTSLTVSGETSVPTANAGNSSKAIANTEYVQGELTNYLPLSGGTLTGIVDGVTPPNGDNSKKLATTAFVNAKVGNYLPLTGGTMTGSIRYVNNGKVFAIGNTSSGNIDLGWNWDNREGAGIGLRSTDYPGSPGGFSLFARNANNTCYLDGKTDGSLTWNLQPLLPIGVVQAFAGTTLPTGWLLCDGAAVSRTDYAALYAVIGTTYGAGDGSTTFNLPNLVDKFVEGSATAGTVKSAGLPNITGYVGEGLRLYGNTQKQGALESKNPYDTAPAGGNYNAFGGISFDASLSNSIYGNSTTVQPPALTMRYIIKY